MIETGTSRFDSSGAFNNFLPINPQLGATGPYSISEIYQNVVSPGTTPLLSFPNPYPSSTASASLPSQSVNGYPRNVSHGRIHQYSLSYEQEIAHFGLRASYLGSVGTGLNYLVNVNLSQPSTTSFTASRRPYPQFFSRNLLRFDGGTRFNALQLEAKRRLGGVTLNASYSLTESLVNCLDTENPYDVLNHWANDGQTRRNYTDEISCPHRAYSLISNLFNHPQFLNPSGNISVPEGNQFTSQYGTFDSLERGQVRQITFLGGFTF
jgi:hypothetical protein